MERRAGSAGALSVRGSPPASGHHAGADAVPRNGLALSHTEIYERHHNRLGGRIELFVMDPLEGIDIDAEEDFVVAEQLLRRAAEERSVPEL